MNILQEIQILRGRIVDENEYSQEVETVCQAIMAIEREIGILDTDWNILGKDV